MAARCQYDALPARLLPLPLRVAWPAGTLPFVVWMATWLPNSLPSGRCKLVVQHAYVATFVQLSIMRLRSQIHRLVCGVIRHRSQSDVPTSWCWTGSLRPSCTVPQTLMSLIAADEP